MEKEITNETDNLREVMFISEDLKLIEGYQLVNHYFVDLTMLEENYKDEVMEIFQHTNKLYFSCILETYGSAFIGNSVKKGKFI